MSTEHVSMLDFYRLQRQQQGLATVIKPHHVKIANTLTKLVLGQLPTQNVMILMPPRCSKTSEGVQAFVPWASSYFPDSEFIISSYSSDLATQSAVVIRETLASDWYRNMCDGEWGAHLHMRGNRGGGRQDYFHTREGGSVKAIGVEGGITGFGAGKLRQEFGGCLILDDLLKAQDEKSPTKRKSAFEYVQRVLKSRRNRDDTPIVLIMQRLHPEDPAGMLLREERELWTVVQLQAYQEDGTSIWEERISAASLEIMMEADPQLYWSQYQQEPSQSSRSIFKDDWWRYWVDRAAVEKRLTLKIITADTAFKDKDSADFSVFQCWGFEGISGAYLIDQVRGQWDFPDLLQNARGFLSKHATPTSGITPATEAWVEDKASGTSLVQTLRREGLPFREWLPDAKTAPDKVARGKQCSLPISCGRVFIPDPKLPGNSWVKGWKNEHTAFTDDDSHLYDDQVDTETEALLIWMQRGGGRGPLPVWNDLYKAA